MRLNECEGKERIVIWIAKMNGTAEVFYLIILMEEAMIILLQYSVTERMGMGCSDDVIISHRINSRTPDRSLCCRGGSDRIILQQSKTQLAL